MVMRIRQARIVMLALLIFEAIGSHTAFASDAALSISAEQIRRVDEVFIDSDRMDSPGMAVGIIQDGRLIYARGYGSANLEHDIPITAQTVFRTGSIGKQFTAMCIAILAERGEISLDDDIRKYLPEMQEYDWPVTIRHLIHHTSGLRGYLVLQGLAGRVGDYFFTMQEGIDLLSRQKMLNFTPGEKYLYSNSGYFLLGEIVSRVSGMTLREFAKRNLFEPLGMNDTHIHDDRNRVVRNRATGYAPIGEGKYRIDTTQLEIVGDGSVFTTIEDFFKWDQNFYLNRLGNGTPDLIQMVLTPGKLNNGEKNKYAFGLYIDTYRGLRRVSHSGSYKGYIAEYTRFPDLKFSVVIFANTNAVDPDPLAVKVTEIFLGEHFTGEKPTPTALNWQGSREESVRTQDLSQSKLSEYLGDFFSEELDVTARLEIEKGELVMNLVRTSDILKAVQEDQFITTYSNDDAYELMTRYIEFVRSDGGKVSGFVMQADPIRNLGFEKVH